MKNNQKVVKNKFFQYTYSISMFYVEVEYTESEDVMLAVDKKKLETNDRYLQQLEDIKIRVPKGYREVIKTFAIEQGYKNVNQFVIGLVNEKMESVDYAKRVPTGVKEVKGKE